MLCLMITLEGANVIADLSHLRFRNIDIGYGPGAYGCVFWGGGVLALASLPLESVDRFHMESRKQIRSAIQLKPNSAL